MAAVATDVRINAMRIHDVWIKLVQLCRAAAFAVAREQDRMLGLRMAQKQARQFKTGIAGCSHNRGLNMLWHQATIPSNRKSTRLNSSHTVISYAVFCLKKK